MHRVVQVLDEHLPVAVVQVAQHAARDLQLARRRAVGQQARNQEHQHRHPDGQGVLVLTNEPSSLWLKARASSRQVTRRYVLVRR